MNRFIATIVILFLTACGSTTAPEVAVPVTVEQVQDTTTTTTTTTEAAEARAVWGVVTIQRSCADTAAGPYAKLATMQVTIRATDGTGTLLAVLNADPENVDPDKFGVTLCRYTYSGDGTDLPTAGNIVILAGRDSIVLPVDGFIDYPDKGTKVFELEFG